MHVAHMRCYIGSCQKHTIIYIGALGWLRHTCYWLYFEVGTRLQNLKSQQLWTFLRALLAFAVALVVGMHVVTRILGHLKGQRPKQAATCTVLPFCLICTLLLRTHIVACLRRVRHCTCMAPATAHPLFWPSHLGVMCAHNLVF